MTGGGNNALVGILIGCAIVVTASIFKFCSTANEPKVVRLQVEITGEAKEVAK